MNHSIRGVYTPDNQDASTSMLLTVDAINYCGDKSTELWGIVGPKLSRSAVPAALVAHQSNLPLVSYSATSTTLSDKST
jgi:hypothetical protein